MTMPEYDDNEDHTTSKYIPQRKGFTMADSKSIRKRKERLAHIDMEIARLKDCKVIIEDEIKRMEERGG